MLDQEEEIALQEFAKFEEKLKHQKELGTVASITDKAGLDQVET